MLDDIFVGEVTGRRILPLTVYPMEPLELLFSGTWLSLVVFIVVVFLDISFAFVIIPWLLRR